MDKPAVIDKLNWFYSLEMNQVELYKGQSEQVEDIYLKKLLERVSLIEQEHVDNIYAMISNLGGTPTRLGEAVAPVTGKIAGLISGHAGLITLLKANVDLEEKAMKDYKDFLLRAGSDEKLFDLLWSNLVDEDLHTAWFTRKIYELEQNE